MKVKHLLAIAAFAGYAACGGLCRADAAPDNGKPSERPAADGNGIDDSFDNADAGSGAKPNSSPTAKPDGVNGRVTRDQLNQDFAQIQADFKQIQKDCDEGKYEQAQKDLDLLLLHREKYNVDRGQVNAGSSSDNSTTSAAGSPGK